ncbi:V-type ATP synthase subunit E [uncultured Anaerococcus sp.]|uniref:V-type ATP synthase subunit E n=1 Tax=uncultured Anaerococcus sp. TaxID=293428 RepID=UPI0028894D10|nr:V-type ATP synthase subunit E [uncultured Anaerococcus sp.]
MNNLDLILESIKNKAEEEKNQILDEAKKEAEQITNEAKERAAEEVKTIISYTEKECTLVQANEELSSTRRARDIKIGAKNELINQVIAKVLSGLKDLESPAYKRFVLNRLEKFPYSSAEIFLKKGMEGIFDSSELKGLKVSEETTDDGFIIKDGNITYDNSFSSIIDYEKDEIKKIISDALFTKEEI